MMQVIRAQAKDLGSREKCKEEEEKKIQPIQLSEALSVSQFYLPFTNSYFLKTNFQDHVSPHAWAGLR